jgi:alkylated DNA repair dioxygenase AlkB
MMFVSKILVSSLFPSQSLFPAGFSYFENFLDETDEIALYKIISGIQLHTFNFRGFEAKRKVMSFGYDYNFDQRTISKGTPIPPAFQPLIDKVAAHLSVNPDEFAELLVTEYPAGSVINWHRDAPPFDLVAGISLLTDCVFRLRPYDKAKQGRTAIISLPVRRRSLYVMQTVARSEYEHSIAPLKHPRYSITLRTLR